MPEGSIGRMFRTIAELMPPPPGGQPPILWGTEDHVREMWGDAEFERHEIVWTDESVESYARFMLESFGPLLNAREVLGEREDELDERLHGTSSSRENQADDGTLRFSGEYLVSVVRALDSRALEDLDLLDRAARAEHDAGERVVGEPRPARRSRPRAARGSRAGARRRRRAGCRCG